MSKTLPERLRDAARKLRTSSMPLSDYIPLLQQAADYIEAQGVPDVDALTDAIAEGLRGTYHCTRAWEAWHVGTMDQDDFGPVDESDTPRELAETVIAMLAAAPPAPQASLEQQEPVMYQFRWTNPAGQQVNDTAIEWTQVEPRWNGTVQEKCAEILAHRYGEKPCYEVRALYTSPQAAQPLSNADGLQISRALHQHGLTLVRTVQGFGVMKLGEITAYAATKGTT